MRVQFSILVFAALIYLLHSADKGNYLLNRGIHFAGSLFHHGYLFTLLKTGDHFYAGLPGLVRVQPVTKEIQYPVGGWRSCNDGSTLQF